MASYKNKFTDLGELNTKQLTDDYVFNTFETIKIKGKTGNNGNFQLKSKTDLSSKESKFTNSNELKIDFPLASKYFLWYGVRSNGDLKLHFDGGNTQFRNKDYNLFANVKTTTTRQNFNFRFGANYWGKTCTSNTRVEVDTANTQNVNLTHRNLIRHGNYLFGFVATLGLPDFAVRRNDFVLGYESEKVDAYVSHLNTSKTGNSLLGRAVVDAVYKHNKDHRFALNATEDFATEALTLSVGHTSQVNSELTVKNRIDLNLRFASALKYKVNSLFTVTGSLLLDFKAPSLFDTKQILPLPVGFQFDFNI